MITKKSIKIPLYGGSLTIVCGDTLQEAADFAGLKDDVSRYAALAATKGGASGGKQYMVLISKDTSPGQIAHEAKHIVNMIYSYIGQNLDCDNDEAECYLLEWVFGQVCDVFEKAKSRQV